MISLAFTLQLEALRNQGKFWEFHDLLFNSQEAENSGWAKAENMKIFASKLNLDRDAFDVCLDSEKYKSFVETDFAFARNVGVTGTPTFVIVKKRWQRARRNIRSTAL